MSSVSWGPLLGIAASWVISPLMGGIIAAFFLAFVKEYIIYRQDKIAAARQWVPVLIAIMTGSFTAYLVLKGLRQLVHVNVWTAIGIGLVTGFSSYYAAKPLIARQSKRLENRNQSLRKLFRIPLIISAALLSFAHGANDVANAIGPLAAIIQAAQSQTVSGQADVPFWVMIIGALGISIGLLMFGPRLIKLVGEQVTKLNPMRAFCVALSAALTVIVASALGLPISSTHVAVGAVFGVGFFREWYTRNSKRRAAYIRTKGNKIDADEIEERNADELRRRYLVRRSHFMTIVAAWIITVPASAALAAVVYFILSGLFA